MAIRPDGRHNVQTRINPRVEAGHADTIIPPAPPFFLSHVQHNICTTFHLLRFLFLATTPHQSSTSSQSSHIPSRIPAYFPRDLISFAPRSSTETDRVEGVRSRLTRNVLSLSLWCDERFVWLYRTPGSARMQISILSCFFLLVRSIRCHL